MDDVIFENKKKENIKKLSQQGDLKKLSNTWLEKVSPYSYSYNFTWLGRPIIQLPQDILAIQEIIWKNKPDLIIETGIARGGSLIFYASLLELIGENGKVIGIDIDIRKHNEIAIKSHSMYKRIEMFQGSSIDLSIIEKVKKEAKNKKNVMVILDSNHTYEHVLKELFLYEQFVTSGNYLIVLDTVIEDMPEDLFKNRPWNKKNNPKKAVYEFLSQNDKFEIDDQITDKILITVAPSGYLKCK